MSVAVMEALAQGCAVVSTRVSGIEDLENHPLAKSCIKLYEIGDIMEAADKIVEVCSIDPIQREINAKALAQEELSIETCVASYLKLDYIPAKNQHKQASTFDKLLSITLATLRLLKYRLFNWRRTTRK